MFQTSKQMINLTKANKGIKYSRQEKFKAEKFWKRAKNVALHVQSRDENEFDMNDILVPDATISRRQLRYDQNQWNVKFDGPPLGAGW